MKPSTRITLLACALLFFCPPRSAYASAGAPGDRDNDGIPDAEDNCPDRANRDQKLFRYFPDADGDTYGTDEGAIEACERPTGFTTRGGDCNDDDPAIHPNAIDDGYLPPDYYTGDGIDNDCNGRIDDGPRGRPGRSLSSFHEPECSEVGSDWTLKLDQAASNQRYYVVENGHSTLSPPGNDPEQRIRFTRDVDSDFDLGSFFLYIRARKADNTSGSSLWIRTNDSEWKLIELATDGQFRWFETRIPTFKNGNNTIDVASRQDGTEVDNFHLNITGDGLSNSGESYDDCGGIYFPPNEQPKAIARANRTSGVAPLSIDLDGSASSDPENDSLFYRWEWNGGSATGVKPTAVFATGIYEVTLTVSDLVKNTDRATLRINATDPTVDPTTAFWLEAECAEVGANWTPTNRPSASEGVSVVVPKLRSLSQPPPDVPANRIRFRLKGVRAGNYTLFARLAAPGPDSDSYWVRANNGPWIAWRDGLIRDGTFAWNRFRNVVLPLTNGNNTVDFAYRENGTNLDKIHLNLTGVFPTGLGITATNCARSPDSDGDGIPDDEDICPAVPNPDQIEKIFYADQDGDGFGDPGTAIVACVQPAGYVTNGRDNCPTLNSPDITDSDGDGIGNSCDDDLGSSTNFWLEAECATLAPGWATSRSGSASGGKYVAFREASNTAVPSPVNPAREVRFDIEVTESGTYQVFLRMQTFGNGANLFWVRFDDRTWIKMWQNVGGSQLSTTGMEWKQLTDDGKLVSFNLAPGRHVLSIANRESFTALDKVFVSTLTALPTGNGQPAQNCTPVAARSTAPTASLTKVLSETPPESALRLYPNPVGRELTLEATGPYTGSVLARIFDASGRLVLEQRYPKDAPYLRHQLPVENLPRGLYRLQITEGDRQTVNSFVKQ